MEFLPGIDLSTIFSNILLAVLTKFCLDPVSLFVKLTLFSPQKDIFFLRNT